MANSYRVSLHHIVGSTRLNALISITMESRERTHWSSFTFPSHYYSPVSRGSNLLSYHRDESGGYGIDQARRGAPSGVARWSEEESYLVSQFSPQESAYQFESNVCVSVLIIEPPSQSPAACIRRLRQEPQGL